jgi:hypothetical protein
MDGLSNLRWTANTFSAEIESLQQANETLRVSNTNHLAELASLQCQLSELRDNYQWFEEDNCVRLSVERGPRESDVAFKKRCYSIYNKRAYKRKKLDHQQKTITCRQ